jgi:hypothetical protein
MSIAANENRISDRVCRLRRQRELAHAQKIVGGLRDAGSNLRLVAAATAP